MNDTPSEQKPLRRPMALPGGPDAHARRDAMVRVDHAGEVGAVKIYQGQLAVLNGREAAAGTARHIHEMAEQEARHLAAFDRLVRAHNVRPTALRPLWDVAGFTLGAVTALMGEKAAMACTVAVEDVIEEHYARQSDALKGGTDTELRQIVDEFRADEAAHRALALSEGAEKAPGYRLLSAAIKAGCRMAIKLSEKI